MLDYTILNKEEKNFAKTIETFDIRNAVNEIIEILEDKISMKSLQVELHFVGFDKDSYNVLSDQKRIQQAFLNIISNAVKFTDRDGKIMILVEY
jgi:signal transduction histidine kinase